MEYTLEELAKETCSSFGGNNCVLHQCMFGCVLEEAKKKAREKAGKKDDNKSNTK